MSDLSDKLAIEAVPSAKSVDKDINVPNTDTISRQASFDNHGEIKSYAKDTIYRQDAIDTLKAEQEVLYRNIRSMSKPCELLDRYSAQYNQIEYDISTIQHLPSAQPEDMCSECDAWNQYKNYPSAQRWTPCSKELPKKDGDYYVTTHNGQIARYIFIKGVSEEYWMRCATAWMPLPEPYKGE